MSAGLASIRLDPHTCPHERLKFLDSWDDDTLFECEDCGGILATIDGLLWPVAPSPSGPENQDFSF